MTRIRYTKEMAGLIVSMRSYIAGSNIVKVAIESIDNQFSIKIHKLGNNSQLDEVLVSTSTKNLSTAKKTAKTLLTEQGVQFADEVRRAKLVDTLLVC
jgi:phosphoribosylaminoimidazole-succinocarboxamide synthase